MPSKGKKLDGRGAKDMPAMMNAKPGSGVVTNNVANGMLKDPGAVKVFMCSWANFNFSCTGADRWDKAMAKVPFFVHLVTNASEMTQFADIVLPATFNSAEGWSIVSNMGNGHGYASIQQGAVKRLWDVKQEETEVMWLLAEKLKAKGFPNLFDYYSQEFKDPETGKAPDHGAGVQPRSRPRSPARRSGRPRSRSRAMPPWPAGTISARRACSAARSTRSRRAGAASSPPRPRSSSSTARR